VRTIFREWCFFITCVRDCVRGQILNIYECISASTVQALSSWVALAEVGVSLDYLINSSSDSLEANPGDGIYRYVSGHCSLSALLPETKAHVGTDMIIFVSSPMAGQELLSVDIR